jgi:plasmid stabilization system protein ParE
MTPRYVLAPEAADDLVRIWRYIGAQSSIETADRVEAVILGRLAFLADTPGAGHWRRDLTDKPVRFFPIYSYLIVYLPETKPMQVISILHGHRDLRRLLKNRL